MRLIIPALLLIGCTTNSLTGSPEGQYLSTNHTITPTDKYFVFRLDDYCSTGILKTDSSMADTAYKQATKWRAWSEVGERAEKQYFDLPIKKGPHSWEPSCDHPWNADSIGNVKSVVVWD